MLCLEPLARLVPHATTNEQTCLRENNRNLDRSRNEKTEQVLLLRGNRRGPS